MRTIDQADLQGKRVLCRIDCDIPFNGQAIVDDNRLRAAIPSIDFILQAHPARLVLISHRGRPQGLDPQLTLEPVADYLAKHYGSHTVERLPGQFANQLDLFKITEALYLTENVRFIAGENDNDPGFVSALAKEGDIVIFDAFADAHRDHASTSGLANTLPSYAGLHLTRELQSLDLLRGQAQHPLIFIIGGSKIEDKLPVIENLANQADRFLIGGVVANTLLKASGMDIKQSLTQDQFLEEGKQILSKYSDKIVLPTDHVWDGEAIMDIGPRTIMEFEDVLADAKTVFWNGNLGKTEDLRWSKGSLVIADILSRSPEMNRIVAGGDTVGFLSVHHLVDSMTFVSTGGGATLEYLAGKELPALAALE